MKNGTDYSFKIDKEFARMLDEWLKDRRTLGGIDIHECSVQKAAEKLLEELIRERN